MARLNGIAESNAFQTSAASAAATLATLAEIPDERERAVVFGAFTVIREQKDNPLAAIRTRLKAVVEAAEQGKPCPRCGKVHEESGGHGRK